MFSCFVHYSKDVRLPVQLQRAMATEAEAAREARAKVSHNTFFCHIVIMNSLYTLQMQEKAMKSV